MGNHLSRPYRPPKERPMAFLRRKLGKMTRKDRINRMVSLTFLKDEAKLHQFAEWAKLTSDELRIYYKKIDSIVGEFNTDIPEVEFRYSPEMTSDSETSSISSDASDNALGSVITVESPVYSDPVKQKNFEQFCLAQYGTTICVHQNEGSINTPVEADMADIVSHKPTVSGDTKHSENNGSKLRGNLVNSSGTKKHRSPRNQRKSPRRQKKSVRFAEKAQICVTPESKEAKMIPKFNSPSRQPVLHTPVPVVQTDITLKTWKNADDVPINEQTDQPPTVVHHSPDTSLSKPLKEQSKVTQKKSSVKKAYPKSSIDQDANEATVFKSPAKKPILHTPVPPKAASDNPQPDESKEIPVFSSPSKQRILHTPVQLVVREPLPDPSVDTESARLPSVADEAHFKPKITSTARESIKPDLHSESFGHHTSVLSKRQPESALLSQVGEDKAHCKPNSTSTVRLPEEQDMHSQAFVLPVSVRSERKPVSQPQDQMPTKQNISHSSVKQDASKEVPIFRSPSKQLIVHTPVPIKARVTETPVDIPEAKEVPTFKDPSKQLVVHTPVPIIARVTETPVDDTDAKEVPVFKSPSKQLIVHTPVPIVARVTEKPEDKPEAKEVPVFKSPSKQIVVHTPVPIIARVTDKAEEIQEDKEVPVFLSPSRQPVLYTPVPTIAKGNATGSNQADLLRSPVPRLDLQLSPDDINIPMATDSQDSSLPTPNTDGRSRSQASLKHQAKLPGKINEGLLTKNKAQARASVPKRSPKIPEQPLKNVKETPASDKATADTEKGSATKAKSSPKKPGIIKRCVDNLKRRTESALSNRQVIKVKPATPECTVENLKPVKSQPSHLKSTRPKVVKKRVISQTNLRPDKGIVWPTEFETLNAHNKSYYVEQFLRSELFKQRCKRKQKGGTSWMNGLTKFQLWVVEHEGKDAIEEVLNPVKKNKSDAKAKVQCWRGDSPEC